jgi:small subunit ribosomal protein S6
MREYETSFIVQPEISEEGREALLQRLGGLLQRAGAVALEVDDQGKRKLAYEIRKFQKGHYLALFYLGGGGAVSELERALRLDESVLRYLTTVRADAVDDVDARKARAVEAERLRKERAAERAAREAEERAARQEADEQARAHAGADLDEDEGDEADDDEASEQED